jgi:hypothetical protein
MRYIVSFFLLLVLPIVLGCDSQLPLSPVETSGHSGNSPETLLNSQGTDWGRQLAQYRRQIAGVLSLVKGSEDLSELLGGGNGSVSGDGTFIGEGNGNAKLEGVGIVTGELTGTALIEGTTDINISGLVYMGEGNGFRKYEGSGYFTATSEQAQEIEVEVSGDGWVIGAGTGIAMWSGQGWVFWYHQSGDAHWRSAAD